MNTIESDQTEQRPNALLSLLKMSRPLNLLLIVFTFLCFRFGFGSRLEFTFTFATFFGHVFLLLTILLTASAGNFINDYFDKKVDAINKPNLNSVDKGIKRRVVILAHILTNLVGLLCALAASVLLNSWMPIVITLVIIFVLTIYTPFLKKMYLTGNVAVATCIAILPIWALWPEVIRIDNWYVQSWTLVYVLFAFCISLTREIIKDIEDVEGDKLGNYQTIAVKSGVKVAKLLGLFSMAMTLFTAVFSWVIFMTNEQSSTQLLYLTLVVFPLLVSFLFLVFAKTKKGFTNASMALKIAMFLGIAFSLFLR